MSKNYCLVPENYKSIKVYNPAKLLNFSDIANVKEDISFTHYIDSKDLATFFYIGKNETSFDEITYLKAKISNSIKVIFNIFEILKLDVDIENSIAKVTLAYTADGSPYNPAEANAFFKNTIVTHQYFFNIYEKWKGAV